VSVVLSPNFDLMSSSASQCSRSCVAGHFEMVKFLLEKGADLEHKTDEMHTALMEASMDGHVEVARLLLDHGAQVGVFFAKFLLLQ
jgi:ankyrin repeat protein